MTTAISKPLRATAVVERHNRVLLVREKGEERFKLPGGGLERNELALEAALRELREQTGLQASKAEHIFDHKGNIQLHKVVLVQAQGTVKLQKREIADYKWWDRNESIPLLWAAKAIIDRCTNPKW